MAETEFALQVESDIAPYKGLLMGLFFMTVGMEISVGLVFAEWKTVVSGIVLLIGGKVTFIFDFPPSERPIFCILFTLAVMMCANIFVLMLALTACCCVGTKCTGHLSLLLTDYFTQKCFSTLGLFGCA